MIILQAALPFPQYILEILHAITRTQVTLPRPTHRRLVIHLIMHPRMLEPHQYLAPREHIRMRNIRQTEVIPMRPFTRRGTAWFPCLHLLDLMV